MTPPGAASALRLPELLASVSLAIDLGLGLPLEHVARSSLLGQHFARRVGLDADDRDATYYVALLAWIGCTADSYEVAQLFGDDHRWRAESYEADLVGLGALRYMLRQAGTDDSPLEKLRARAAVLTRGGKTMLQSILGHCQVTGILAGKLGLSDAIRTALSQNFARWDGKGLPADLGGDDIALSMRVVHIADHFEVMERKHGLERAVDTVVAQTGKAFDPELAEAFCGLAAELVDDLDPDTNVERLVEEAPESSPTLRGGEIDTAMAAIGDFVDLKSPYFAGHSRGVAGLAHDAALGLGLAPDQARTVRRAGYLHDLGRAGIPNTIWDREGPLSRTEYERVRLHAYYTERVLSRPVFEPLRVIAASHHERVDGSGYHKGVSGAQLQPLMRVLAAADTYHAMLEPRPHRPARTPDGAAAELRTEVEAGRLDGDAAEAVLAAAGQAAAEPSPRRRAAGPAGLTPREVEVLRHLARGQANKEIAAALTISKKTVGNHIEHIYEKIGASTRAAATLFAVQHGLLDPLDPLDPGSEPGSPAPAPA